MKIESLGMIEVKGFLGAIVAADAALKTADVALLNAEKIRGGQTTVQLVGDVSAVQVAVDSGTAAAEDLGCLISSYVIPRMAEETAQMITESITKKNQAKKESEPVVEEIIVEEIVETPDNKEVEVIVKEEKVKKPAKKTNKKK